MLRRVLRSAVITVALAAVALGAAAPSGGAPSNYGVGEIVVRYVDHSRTVVFGQGKAVPRPLPTVIRYPIAASGVDVRGAPPAHGAFPLIVFAHGFAATPGIYAALLRAWVRAGYVVAAPFFPLTNAGTPGGPDESDIVNQPRDVSFVITRILAASASEHGPLAGLVDPRRVAVAGQSDGGSTALDTAYDHAHRDRRLDAAIVLSGAEWPGRDSVAFAPRSPPLLAVQGTADSSNFPTSTYRYFHLARPPKFLLSLFGAGHLAPYTTEQPQLGIVERETIAFLDRYLKHLSGAARRMWSAGDVPGVAALATHAPAVAAATGHGTTP